MLIVCPSCKTAYRIELSALGARGRSVRCGRCRNVWVASAADVAFAALDVPPGPTGATTGGKPDQPPQPFAAAPGGADEAGGDVDIVDQSSCDRPDAPSDHAASVTIADAPSLVPAIAQDKTSALDNGAAAGPDIETLAARRELRANGKSKRRRPARSLPGLPTTILALVVVLAALVNWRAAVVQVLPQTASLFSAVGLAVNIRGLGFDGVKTSVEGHEGVTVLVVEGTIVNLTRQTLDVPRLRFAVRNGAGYEVYAWTAVPPQSVLAPGDAAPFRSRLASPPADGQQVIVRFFNRHDVAAGAH
jgi:predicted Zn finger-like uncharacterized protein